MEEINQIFGRRNFPAIIGRKSFDDKILKAGFLLIKLMKRFLNPDFLPRTLIQ